MLRKPAALFVVLFLSACGGGGGGGSGGTGGAPAMAVGTTVEFTRGYAQFTGTPAATAAGDIDGDGRDDFVVATRSADQLYVFYQRANGPESVSIASAAEKARSAAVCDVDGDGRNEILVGYELAPLAIYKPGADGRPALSQVLAGVASDALVCADLDGDGLSDVITTGKAGVAMQVLLQRNRTLVEQGGLAGDPVAALDVGDVNGDGKADVVASGSAGAMVYVQTSPGQFAAPVPLNFAGTPADVKGLAVGPRSVVFSTPGYVVIAASSGAPVSLATLANPGYVRVRDLNADGRADIAVFHDGALGIYYQNADGSFAAEQALATYPADATLGTAPIAFGDFDGDGRLDVAVASRTGVSLFFQEASP